MAQPIREPMLTISYQQVVLVEKEEGFIPYSVFFVMAHERVHLVREQLLLSSFCYS